MIFRKRTGPFPASLPIDQIPFLVFDTETTGLDPKKDRLLSVGAVRMKGGIIPVDQSFELIVEQGNTPVSGQIAVHGIRQSAAGKVTEKEALETFLALSENTVLVGHHLYFDLALIQRLAGQKLSNPTLDTHALAIRLDHGFHAERHEKGGYGLDQLCQRFNLPQADRHTAGGDAYLTALLLCKLLYRLQKKGVKTLADLLRKPGLF